MREQIKDNNAWVSSENGQSTRADGTVVKEGDPDTVPNPNFGQVTIVGEDDPPIPVQTISRVRFEATFADAIGNAAYEQVLVALQAIAATDPITDETAALRRALRGINNPSGIDHPVSPWRVPVLEDLTASFLKLAHDALVGTMPDIADKIDAGLAAWPKV